jgi:ribosomal protein S3AE
LSEAKKIANLRHIGIKKTKLISTPESRAIEEAKPIEVASESTPSAAEQ